MFEKQKACFPHYNSIDWISVTAFHQISLELLNPNTLNRQQPQCQGGIAWAAASRNMWITPALCSFLCLSCNFSRKIRVIRKLHLAAMLLVWKWPTKLQTILSPLLLSSPPHSQSASKIWSSLAWCCLELSCCTPYTFLLCLGTVDKRSPNIYVGHIHVCQYCHVLAAAKCCLFLLFWYMVGYCRALASVLLQMLGLFHSSSLRIICCSCDITHPLT